MTPDIAAAILNVNTSSSRAEIDKAYTLRARMSHPDRFAGAPAADIRAATAEFVRITEARDVLRSQLPETAPAPPNPPQNRTQQNPPPQAKPMSFEDFVRVRDAQSWSTNPLTAPQSSSATATPQMPGPTTQEAAQRRERRLAWIALTGLVLIAVFVALISLLLKASPEGDSAVEDTTTVDIYDDVEQEIMQDPESLGRLCMDSSTSCWIWTLTPSTNCEAAAVTVHFRETPDGKPVRSNTQVIYLKSGVPTTLIEDASSGPEYAGIVSIVC